MTVERTQVEREVGFMYDAQASFVSLVNRGANQIPFKIVKGQQEKPMKVLHSIIVKSGTAQEAIRGLLTEEVAPLAKFDAPIERGGSTSYVQVPREKFKADSLELVVIDKEQGVMALQGELAEQEGSGIVAKFFSPKKSAVPALALADAEPVAVEVIKAQYCYELYDELDAAWSAIRGVMAQEMGDAAAKISAANAVLDNLRAYINEAVFLTKGQALVKQEADTQVSDGAGGQEVSKEPEVDTAPTAPEDEPVVKEQKPEDQAAKADGQVVTELVQGIDVASVIKGEVEKAMKPLQDQIQTLTVEKAKMEEKIASLEATPAGTLRIAGDVDADGGSSAVKAKSQASVFDGLIFASR